MVAGQVFVHKNFKYLGIMSIGPVKVNIRVNVNVNIKIKITITFFSSNILKM